ncbi:MAG: N-acetyltransferase [Pseudomonadota bacterium]
MKLRNMREDDRSAVLALHIESWQKSYRGIAPDAFLDHEAAQRLGEKWHHIALGAEDFGLILEDGDSVAGFAFVRKTPPQVPLLDNLHIRPGARGAGLGKLLMAGVAARLIADGDIGMRLIVLRDNTSARHFYRRASGIEGPEFMDDFFGTDIPAHEVVWADLSRLL